MVLVREHTFPGCMIRCRTIGMFRMTDEAGGDDKLICVVAGDPRVGPPRDIEDLDEFDRLGCSKVYRIWSRAGRSKAPPGRVGEAAEAEVIASREREAERLAAGGH